MYKYCNAPACTIGLLHKSWSLSSTFFPRLPRATTEVFSFYFYTISKSVFAAMWARWSDILFSRKKFTRKHGRHGQTLKIYFSRTNWIFLTKTWGIIRELLLYPKHIFTDFWNNGKWKKQNKVKASASQKQPADRHHAVVPKWLICAIFICPLPVTLKIRKNMF